jgi:hypothetical protein
MIYTCANREAEGRSINVGVNDVQGNVYCKIGSPKIGSLQTAKIEFHKK